MESGDVTSEGVEAAEGAASVNERRHAVDLAVDLAGAAPAERKNCFEEELSSSVVYVPPAAGELSLSGVAPAADERQSSVELIGMARSAGLAGALEEDGARVSRAAPLALGLGAII